MVLVIFVVVAAVQFFCFFLFFWSDVFIHFLIRKLSSQEGFHLDGFKYLIPDLFFNTVFPDCNLSGWLC